MNIEKALKAITITSDTVLFVDIDQIRISQIENCESLPKGLLIIGVMGEPNVLAMTRQELKVILDQKNALLLPREGKTQEPQHDGSDHFYAENFSNFKGWGEQDKTDNPIAPVDLGGELEEGCYMYGGGEDGLCPESTNCPGCAQERRIRAQRPQFDNPRDVPGNTFKFPEWSEARLRELADAEPGGLMACSPELLAELKEQAKTDANVAATLILAGMKLDVPAAKEEECGYCGGTGEVACSSTSYMSCPACSKKGNK